MDTDTRLAVIEEKIDKLTATVDDLKHSLEGNGNPGLKIRLDRVEQRVASYAKWLTVAGTAAVGSLAGHIKAFLSSHS